MTQVSTKCQRLLWHKYKFENIRLALCFTSAEYQPLLFKFKSIFYVVNKIFTNLSFPRVS